MNQGDRVKKILKRNGFTQQELADHMGKTRTHITRQLLENDLKTDLKEEIAKLLKMSVKQLEKELQEDTVSIEVVETLRAQLAEKERVIQSQQDELKAWKIVVEELRGKK